MKFYNFKNTLLLWVLLFISSGCSARTGKGQDSSREVQKKEQTQVTDSTIIVGANRTEKYLPLLRNKRVGVVANQTSVIFHGKTDTVFDIDPETNEKSLQKIFPRTTHLIDSLISLNITVKKAFAPEHGFRGKADAGEAVVDGTDKQTGLPVASLYGKNKKPKAEQLEDLDIVVFDIQDVGVRFYTYISTLHYVMEACAQHGIPVVVLDRPNPNGDYIDGPTLKEKHASFLGMHPIPLVHGMTIGEYAQMINGQKWLAGGIACNLTVIPIANYTHHTPYSLPIRPSPNLPNDQSIALYPSLGLFEGTTINAGRGTEFQFQRYGSPDLEPEKFDFSYTPHTNFGAKYPKHKDVQCIGEDLSAVNPPRAVSLQWLLKAYHGTPKGVKFFNTDSFTKHAGTDTLQKQIEAGLTETEIRKNWLPDIAAFKKIRKQYLLYP